MSFPSAARTNLTSRDVRISNEKLGEGSFRVCMAGTFIGGNRNQQEAACKRFKPRFRSIEDEFYEKDFKVIDKAIDIAESWNDFCECGKEILITRGSIHYSNSGIKYLVEPLIRYYEKYTSNNGWIGDTDDWEVRAMEAFSHYSYHESGGRLIVCDLQGRYRNNTSKSNGCRFELTDPAICSRRRSYGPTDLGEKGIESFFSNHSCNKFCKKRWSRPNYPSQWFPFSSGTSMLSSRLSSKLVVSNRTTFHESGLMERVSDSSMEEDSDDSDSS